MPRGAQGGARSTGVQGRRRSLQRPVSIDGPAPPPAPRRTLLPRALRSLAGLPRDAVLSTLMGTAPRRDTPQAQVGPTSGQWRGTPDDALAGVRGRAVSDVLGGPHTATKRWP